MPQYYGPPTVDIAGQLSQLGDTFQQNAVNNKQRGIEDARKQVFSTPGDWNSKVQQLLSVGDTEGATKAALIGKALQPERMNPFQEQTVKHWERQDAAAGTGKPLSEATTTKLSDEGGSYSTLGSLVGTFKPEFAGYTAPQQLEMAKKGYPTLNGDTDKQASEWWDHYGSWAETVRNKMYGSVLTPSDIKEFERYRITPTTDPSMVPTNLKAQQKIVADSIQRKSRAMKASGFNPEAINAAYGLDASGNFPVEAPTSGGKGDMLQGGQPQQAGAATPPPQVGKPSPAHLQLLQQHGNEPGFKEAWEARFGPIPNGM